MFAVAVADFYSVDVSATAAVELVELVAVDFVAVVESFVSVAGDDVPYSLGRHLMTVP